MSFPTIRTCHRTCLKCMGDALGGISNLIGFAFCQDHEPFPEFFPFWCSVFRFPQRKFVCSDRETFAFLRDWLRYERSCDIWFLLQKAETSPSLTFDIYRCEKNTRWSSLKTSHVLKETSDVAFFVAAERARVNMWDWGANSRSMHNSVFCDESTWFLILGWGSFETWPKHKAESQCQAPRIRLWTRDIQRGEDSTFIEMSCVSPEVPDKDKLSELSVWRSWFDESAQVQLDRSSELILWSRSRQNDSVPTT